MPHLNEKIDFTVDVFVVYKDKVFLRFHDKYNLWLTIGGHVELEEDPNMAAIREAKEEAGLNITLYNPAPAMIPSEGVYKQLIPPVFLNIHQPDINNQIHRHCSYIFFATADSDKVAPQDERDISRKWKWCSMDELLALDNISVTIKAYAKEALQILAK